MRPPGRCTSDFPPTFRPRSSNVLSRRSADKSARWKRAPGSDLDDLPTARISSRTEDLSSAQIKETRTHQSVPKCVRPHDDDDGGIFRSFSPMRSGHFTEHLVTMAVLARNSVRARTLPRCSLNEPMERHFRQEWPVLTHGETPRVVKEDCT